VTPPTGRYTHLHGRDHSSRHIHRDFTQAIAIIDVVGSRWTGGTRTSQWRAGAGITTLMLPARNRRDPEIP
jgi:hypothetical protein